MATRRVEGGHPATIPWDVIEWDMAHPPLRERIVNFLRTLIPRIMRHRYTIDLDAEYPDGTTGISRYCMYHSEALHVRIDWKRKLAWFEEDD